MWWKNIFRESLERLFFRHDCTVFSCWHRSAKRPPIWRKTRTCANKIFGYAWCQMIWHAGSCCERNQQQCFCSQRHSIEYHWVTWQEKKLPSETTRYDICLDLVSLTRAPSVYRLLYCLTGHEQLSTYIVPGYCLETQNELSRKSRQNCKTLANG